MARILESLAEIAQDYDAIVFDQWGVLHNGVTPYGQSVSAIERLKDQGQRLAVLSNSGKRSAPNAARIASFGFQAGWFETVMTSGEALWQDIARGQTPEDVFFPIERAPGDAIKWAEGLTIDLVDIIEKAQAILLMGLPDGSDAKTYRAEMTYALERGLPIYCSNPDRASPRGTETVTSPGALAFDHIDRGGEVTFYGKPHLPIFHALETSLATNRLLMVGDSLEHDIAGAAAAGWDTLLVQGGLYANAFADGDHSDVVKALAKEKAAPLPTYMISEVQ